ncbi:MAG: hypothetical protein Q9172_005088 [Xanthocarpia lactea]
MSHAQTCCDKAADSSQVDCTAEQISCSHSGFFGVVKPAAQGPQLPPNVAIERITPATVPSFRLVIGLLLPIRYPDKFFAESVSNATPTSLARAAVLHEGNRSVKRKRDGPSSIAQAKPRDAVFAASTTTGPSNAQDGDALGTVIGGIQCRIEQLPYHPSLSTSSNIPDIPTTETTSYCYIQTLALLSPYRSKGIAAGLLEVVTTTLCREQCYAGTATIYAHVWEENDEALEWYIKRGFQVSNDVLKGYYRRLKPDGARIVWKDLGVNDYLRAQSR